MIPSAHGPLSYLSLRLFFTFLQDSLITPLRIPSSICFLPLKQLCPCSSLNFSFLHMGSQNCTQYPTRELLQTNNFPPFSDFFVLNVKAELHAQHNTPLHDYLGLSTPFLLLLFQQKSFICPYAQSAYSILHLS